MLRKRAFLLEKKGDFHALYSYLNKGGLKEDIDLWADQKRRGADSTDS